MSAFLCDGSQTGRACRCSANSPFRWAESYTPGSSLAMSLQRNAVSAKAASDQAQSKRAEPGNTGANTPMHHVRPADKKAWAKQQVSKLLKPATFAVYSKAKAAKQGGA